MAYTLHPLAPGSYDLHLNGALIGGVVCDSGQGTWTAELLDDLPPLDRPRPFQALEHTFPDLESTLAWLGGAEMQNGG
jgi:hypothetical protein